MQKIAGFKTDTSLLWNQCCKYIMNRNLKTKWLCALDLECESCRRIFVSWNLIQLYFVKNFDSPGTFSRLFRYFCRVLHRWHCGEFVCRSTPSGCTWNGAHASCLHYSTRSVLLLISCSEYKRVLRMQSPSLNWITDNIIGRILKSD